MSRNRGNHNRPNETKKAIIEFLINTPSGMSEEPAIREYLKQKFGISEQKNIKIHLKDLQKSGCIKKKESPGLANVWMIDEAEHIRNIVEKYKDIIPLLQKVEKIRLCLINDFYKQLMEKLPNLAANEEFKKEVEHFSRLLLGTQRGFHLLLSIPHQELITILSDVVANSIEGANYDLIDELKEEMAKECKWSPDYSEKFLNFEKNTVIQGLTIEERKILEVLTVYHDTIFEICVFSDILNGVQNSNAIQYVYTKNKRKVENIVNYFYRSITHTPFIPPHPDHSKSAVKHAIATQLLDMSWAFMPEEREGEKDNSSQ